MYNKKFFNKLCKVASILSNDEFIRCDVVLSSNGIILNNWNGNFVTAVALLSIMHVCEKFHLLFHVDFDLMHVSIYE